MKNKLTWNQLTWWMKVEAIFVGVIVIYWSIDFVYGFLLALFDSL